MPNDVRLKKVKPYPFPAGLDQAGVKQSVEIMLLTARGFIARLDKAIVHVGGHAKCNFEIPVFHKSIEAPVRVLKTYDRVVEAPAKKVERLAEFHFDSPTAEQTQLIERFMNQIGQK